MTALEDSLPLFSEPPGKRSRSRSSAEGEKASRYVSMVDSVPLKRSTVKAATRRLHASQSMPPRLYPRCYWEEPRPSRPGVFCGTCKLRFAESGEMSCSLLCARTLGTQHGFRTTVLEPLALATKTMITLPSLLWDQHEIEVDTDAPLMSLLRVLGASKFDLTTGGKREADQSLKTQLEAFQASPPLFAKTVGSWCSVEKQEQIAALLAHQDSLATRLRIYDLATLESDSSEGKIP